MRPFVTILLAVALSAAAHAQNTVFAKGDTVFVKSPDGSQLAVTSADVKARLDEYEPRQRDVEQQLLVLQKMSALLDQASRLREEKGALSGLLHDVEAKEAEIKTNKKQ